jgi:hypothetical protein
MVGGSERVIIEDWCQQFPSHSVGDLAFGPNGALYVSGGDGASFNYVDRARRAIPAATPWAAPAATRSESSTTRTAVTPWQSWPYHTSRDASKPRQTQMNDSLHRWIAFIAA